MYRTNYSNKDKMQENQGISRRGFLKGVGAGVSLIGLSQMTKGLVGCNLPFPAGPALLNGQEMVGKVTSHVSTIRLVAGEFCKPSTRFRLLYDTVSRSNPLDYTYRESELSGFSQHDPINFELNSLSPSTRYHYRIGYNEGIGWSYRNEYSFHTQRKAGDSFRFCIAADKHIAPYPFRIPLECNIVYENILADNPDFLITLGDETLVAFQGQGPGSYPWPTQEELWQTIQRTRNVVDLACHSMFYLPVNGNHEGLYGWTTGLPQYQYIGEGLSRYLPLPDSITFPEGGDAVGRYGAFSWGDLLCIWLDVVGFCSRDPYRFPGSNAYYLLGDAQKDFLHTTLANSSAPWKFVFAHHLFGGVDACDSGYGRGNANAANVYQQAEIQNMMVQYGAQAFFYGHDHVFSVSEASGIAYICAGNAGSGCPWSEYLVSCYAPSIIYTTDAEGIVPPGHVRVDVTPTVVTVSYIKASQTSSTNRFVAASYVINL